MWVSSSSSDTCFSDLPHHCGRSSGSLLKVPVAFLRKTLDEALEMLITIGLPSLLLLLLFPDVGEEFCWLRGQAAPLQPAHLAVVE